MDIKMAGRLAERRRTAGLSQEALASRLDVSRQAVSKWERGEASPDTDNLIALAGLYGVTLDELLYGDATGDAGEDAEGEAGKEASSGREADEVSESAGAGDSPDAKPTVRISLREGIHVSDPQKGDEVHVGWNGIHVSDHNGEEVHVGPEGVSVHEASGHEVKSDAEGPGVTVDGTHYESWQAARDALGRDLGGSGKSEFRRRWDAFPFPTLVAAAYVAFVLVGGIWQRSLLLLFLIPAYGLLGRLLDGESPFSVLSGVWPVGAAAWFVWRGTFFGMWRSSWPVFLTVPVAWVVFGSLDKWWKRRR